MRRKLDLDLRTLDALTMLIHGPVGAGKTHLGADMLLEEAQRGEVRFLNIQGEDGYRAAAEAIDVIGKDRVDIVEDLADVKAVFEEYRKAKLRALLVDSLKVLYRVVSVSKTGGRMPGKDDFSAIHWEGEGLVTAMRHLAPIVLCLCPSDKSVNQLDGRTYITPDLPGRMAAGCAGWFDFVGYLSAETLGPTSVKRKVAFAPSTGVVTRVRLPKPITTDIAIPEGAGGWRAIWTAIEKSLKKEN